MKMRKPVASVLSLALVLAGCGGGGGGSGSVVTPPPTGTAPTPTPSTAGCSLRERQDWAAARLSEWYLFPETLPTGLNPAGYGTVDAYIDALTATARAQGRDRYFTYLTSIAEENAYYASGSSAGFGFRLAYDPAGGRVFVAESFEGAPALNAGIDRGTEIVAIGTSASDLRTVNSIMTAQGAAGVSDALGPSTAGTTRVLRVTDVAGTRDLTVAKSDFALTPVSSRYGARILDDGGRKVGYVNLRTFIETADPALRAAFGQFKAAGVTQVIVDLRYNGGGLVSIAQLMGDLMGANRAPSDVFDYMVFRPEKSAENETRYFQPKAESIAPTQIAFIGTGGTASASELVINAFLPWLRTGAALIGTNTYGKPVGQVAIDKPACDDRLRVIAFATQNAARQGDYFNGLAGIVEASCRAGDDIFYPLGDPREASTRAALDFLAGRSCTAIAAGGQSTLARRTAARELLTPERPSTLQREVPGAF